jgi:hypothetical protein
MPFTYNPASVVEKEFEILPEGHYPFETVSAKEGVSKSTGKDMIIIDLKVFDTSGKSWMKTVYITDSSLWNLKAYWDSVGHPDMFEKLSQFHDENAYVGKCGILQTKIESYEKDGKTYTNSKVKSFTKKKDQEKIMNIVKPGNVDTFIEDELPF